jgi:hypothetical protein
VALAATFLLRDARGTSDVEIWLGWAAAIRADGVRQAYEAIESDYPPGGPAFVAAAIAAAPSLGLTPVEGLKLSLTAILAVAATLVFFTTRSLGIATAFYAACLLNVVGLLYLDILTAPFLVVAFAAARRGHWPQLLFWLSCAMAVKYQPVLLLPFALIFVVKRLQSSPTRRAEWWPWIVAIGVLWGALVAVFGPSSLIDSFTKASRHNTLSSFGANPLWVMTWLFQAANGGATEIVEIVPASRPMLRVLMLVSVGLYAYVLRRYWRTGDGSFASFCRFTLCGFLVYTLVSAGVHENHLFTASLIAILLAGDSRRWTWTAAAVAIAANVNLLAFYGWTGYIDRQVIGIDLTVWVALIVSAVLVSAFRALLTARPIEDAAS